jgi:predicted transcriptional regulator
MEVALSPEQKAQLLRVATRTGSDAGALAQEAVGRLLDHEEHYIEAVEKGLASLDRGEYISHEDVCRQVDDLLRA